MLRTNETCDKKRRRPAGRRVSGSDLTEGARATPGDVQSGKAQCDKCLLPADRH